jgi:hypothetical protein
MVMLFINVAKKTWAYLVHAICFLFYKKYIQLFHLALYSILSHSISGLKLNQCYNCCAGTLRNCNSVNTEVSKNWYLGNYLFTIKKKLVLLVIPSVVEVYTTISLSHWRWIYSRYKMTTVTKTQ